MALLQEKMNQIIKDLKKEALSLKGILLKLVKFPGNGNYLSKYKAKRVIFEKKCRGLLQLIPKDRSDLRIKIENICAYFKVKAEYKGKINNIKQFNDLLDEIEVEIHNVHLPDVIFPKELERKLASNFSIELEDLKWVYGKSGNCTSFILRKILEKSIFYAFAKNNLTTKIEDSTSPNKFVNLTSMINLASSQKINNKPVLNSKTAHKIAGIKFLGDTSAHNFIVNVDMEDIVPQMPFIVTALKELSVHF